MDKLFLNRIKTITYDTWKNNIIQSDIYRLIISVSGYEERSTYWTSEAFNILNTSAMTDYVIIGFEHHKEKLNRPSNDKFYSDRLLYLSQLSSDEWNCFEQVVQTALQKITANAGEKPIEIHVDYSSMPRHWYCRLPLFLEKKLREKDSIYFWYTPGQYLATDYPTAGVEDFHIFSGKSSLSPKFRTHVFGLGFDRIRSQAIWSVLDPENLVCFYNEPGTYQGYVEKVLTDNKDILAAAKNIFSVPMNDFVYAYSKIAGIVREYRNIGDVILVPDGPKPLILASSMIPAFLSILGIVCFHVTRRKSNQYEPVDVKPAGAPYGFCFKGVKNV